MGHRPLIFFFYYLDETVDGEYEASDEADDAVKDANAGVEFFSFGEQGIEGICVVGVVLKQEHEPDSEADGAEDDKDAAVGAIIECFFDGFTDGMILSIFDADIDEDGAGGHGEDSCAVEYGEPLEAFKGRCVVHHEQPTN